MKVRVKKEYVIYRGEVEPVTVRDAIKTVLEQTYADGTQERIQERVEHLGDTLGLLIHTLHEEGKLSDGMVLRILGDSWEKVDESGG